MFYGNLNKKRAIVTEEFQGWDAVRWRVRRLDYGFLICKSDAIPH
jgi:hypothetical protein